MKKARPQDTVSGAAVTERITAIFQIDGHGYDVELTADRLSWTPLSGERKATKSAGFFRRLQGKGERQAKDTEDDYKVTLSDILGVTMKRRYNTNPQTGVCVGVAVHTYRTKNRMKCLESRVVLLEHPSDELCLFWISRLQQVIDGFKERPRSIKVFLQPCAGAKASRFLYNQKVLPLLEAAKIKLDMTDLQHNEQIKQEMVHLDLAEYDSIVCVGGDGTVSKVVNELLTRVQKDHDVSLKPGCCVIRPTVPVGIIPVGTTNDIAHSVQGVADITTAVIHIILGHRVSVDVCSVYEKGKFLQFAFNSHFGFFGNATKFLHRYTAIGEKKVEAAVLKGLTTSKFRSYDCEIAYIPADSEEDGQPFDYTMCSSRCAVCSSEKAETTMLEPLNMSNTSSGIRALSTTEAEDTRWHVIKAEVLSVSVLSIAGMSELAPLGMGCYTHLADGCVDLVLVKNTDRKQFVRYLRRHGSSKNQFDFPFVECHRCAEVRVRACPRMQPSWTNEKKAFNQTEVKEEPKRSDNGIEVIDDLNSDGSDIDDSSSVSTSDSRQPESAASAENGAAQKWRESKRTKEETKGKSTWCIDHHLRAEDELHFRLHPSAVFIQGLGVAPDYAPDQVKHSCLSIF